MMQVPPIQFKLRDTHAANLRAATEQMANLLQRVGEYHEYRLLSPADRNNLLKEGFAQDLVDNLVYLTERDGSCDIRLANDQHVIGFTAAAYDPSLYADPAIAEQLQAASNGRCYWCESDLSTTGLATDMVHHYRPPAGYLGRDRLRRDAYVTQAYDTDNLLFGCPQCVEQAKGLHFPTIDNRHMPAVSMADERPLLVNPRTENPRDYIRFNPVNGQAYPFDRVQAYYLHKGVEQGQIAAVLWQYPERIPMQQDPAGNCLSSATLDADYSAWERGLTPGDAAQLGRGQTTIEVLNLNRASLQRSRLAHLQVLHLALCHGQPLAGDPQLATPNSPELPVALDALPLLAQRQYCSLSLDAAATWQQQRRRPISTTSATPEANAGGTDGESR